MYDERIERLIEAALIDGELNEKEKQILFRNAQAAGIDLDEFEMILEARLYKIKKSKEDEANAYNIALAKAKAEAITNDNKATTQSEPSESKHAAPKSKKFGDIRKCPACGGIVAVGSASCGECGYAFTEDSGTTAMDRLYARLSAIDNKYLNMSAAQSALNTFRGLNPLVEKPKEKINAIMTFNVPNTRAELLGLLSALQPLADPDAPKNGVKMWSASANEILGYGYWVLFANCINKAKMSFSTDKTFAPYFEYYEKRAAEQKRGGFFSMFKK